MIASPVAVPPDVDIAQQGKRFQEGRFPRAVFTDKQGNGRAETDGLFVKKNREIERIEVPRGIGVRMEFYTLEVHE